LLLTLRLDPGLLGLLLGQVLLSLLLRSGLLLPQLLGLNLLTLQPGQNPLTQLLLKLNRRLAGGLLPTSPLGLNLLTLRSGLNLLDRLLGLNLLLGLLGLLDLRLRLNLLSLRLLRLSDGRVLSRLQRRGLSARPADGRVHGLLQHRLLLRRLRLLPRPLLSLNRLPLLVPLLLLLGQRLALNLPLSSWTRVRAGAGQRIVLALVLEFGLVHTRGGLRHKIVLVARLGVEQHRLRGGERLRHRLVHRGLGATAGAARRHGCDGEAFGGGLRGSHRLPGDDEFVGVLPALLLEPRGLLRDRGLDVLGRTGLRGGRRHHGQILRRVVRHPARRRDGGRDRAQSLAAQVVDGRRSGLPGLRLARGRLRRGHAATRGAIVSRMLTVSSGDARSCGCCWTCGRAWTCCAPDCACGS
jgi:hypothetical protein